MGLLQDAALSPGACPPSTPSPCRFPFVAMYGVHRHGRRRLLGRITGIQINVINCIAGSQQLSKQIKTYDPPVPFLIFLC